MASTCRNSINCILCAVALCGYACAASPIDESLGATTAAFLATPYHSGEAAIGLAGLGAPTGQDFMEFGRLAIKRPPLKWNEAIKRQKETSFREVIWNAERMNC